MRSKLWKKKSRSVSPLKKRLMTTETSNFLQAKLLSVPSRLPWNHYKTLSPPWPQLFFTSSLECLACICLAHPPHPETRERHKPGQAGEAFIFSWVAFFSLSAPPAVSHLPDRSLSGRPEKIPTGAITGQGEVGGRFEKQVYEQVLRYRLNEMNSSCLRVRRCVTEKRPD